MNTRCETCDDSHRVWIASADHYIPCTSCPVPCRECAGDQGRSAYCDVADCHCECHHWLGANERSVPPPEPPTRADLVALLQRWRDLEPCLALREVIADQHTWHETFVALADATDRAITAERRQPDREVQS